MICYGRMKGSCRDLWIEVNWDFFGGMSVCEEARVVELLL